MSEPLGSLIGGALANQRGVWEGRNTVCALVLYALHSVIPRFHALRSWGPFHKVKTLSLLTLK